MVLSLMEKVSMQLRYNFLKSGIPECVNVIAISLEKGRMIDIQ
jgi:hypothetical protein